ncbi:J domain-containing protein [Natronomonas marina]|uniref:J domain-containing protein n=1 Tax=Natronomonas marina TaxID=2961939 RepID=UPI0020C9BF8F|nr:J domain-containing protein [Natronomonas marina]
MQQDRLLVGLTFVFAAMTATVLLIAVAAFEPVLFVLAVPLGAATALFWYQSSGKLRERVARSRRRGTADGPGGGFGAGARREARRDRERARRGQRQRRGRRQRGPAGRQAATGLSPAEAYRRLDLDPGADESDVKRAYRRKVKDVHPDRGGDEEEFKRVTEAYETLVG